MTSWFHSLFEPPPASDPADPFSHPAVRRMSPQDLADLPLAPSPTPLAELATCRDGLTRRDFRVTAGHLPC